MLCRGTNILLFCWSSCRRNLRLLMQLHLLRATPESRSEGDTWSSTGCREHPPCCRFWCSLCGLFLQLLLRMPAASIVCWVGFVTLQQLAIAACWGGSSIDLFRALLVQVAAPAPQTARLLFAVCPHVTKLLAVVTLCEPSLCSVCFYLDCYVAEAG
jgi:hypothetical protein